MGPTASKAHAVQVLGLKMACQKAQSSTPLGTELAGATGNNLCESLGLLSHDLRQPPNLRRSRLGEEVGDAKPIELANDAQTCLKALVITLDVRCL